MAEHDSTQQSTFWDVGTVLYQCRVCGEAKPRGAYSSRRISGRLCRHNHCKKCRNAAAKAARNADPEEHFHYMRRVRLARVFGMSLEDFERMFREQDGVCAICKQPETHKMKSGRVKSLAIDHDHKTGKVRALLCGSCNHMIGNSREDVENLRRAIAYLEQHKAKTD